MTIIVRDDGFHPLTNEDPSFGNLVPFDDLKISAVADVPVTTDLPNDVNPDDVVPFFARLEGIHIPFPSFADGRGFSLARRLRLLGFTGRLRAVGHVLPDQFLLARRIGFDEIEIKEDRANRQPQSQWLNAAGQDHETYQERLRQVG